MLTAAGYEVVQQLVALHGVKGSKWQWGLTLKVRHC